MRLPVLKTWHIFFNLYNSPGRKGTDQRFNSLWCPKCWTFPLFTEGRLTYSWEIPWTSLLHSDSLFPSISWVINARQGLPFALSVWLFLIWKWPLSLLDNASPGRLLNDAHITNKSWDCSNQGEILVGSRRLFPEDEKQQQGRQVTVFKMQKCPLLSVIILAGQRQVGCGIGATAAFVCVCAFIILYLFLFAAMILEHRKNCCDHSQCLKKK